MEPDEIDILAPAVLRNLQKIDKAQETGRSRQTGSNIQQADRLNRIYLDFPFFHLVSLAGFDMRALPDSNAARDFPAPDALPKPLRKDHRRSVYMRLQPARQTVKRLE